MAMNPVHDVPQQAPSVAGEARLLAAVSELRDHTDERWVEIADDMLVNILRRSRPSHPVRAETPGGEFHVSELVLITALRHALDPIARCEITDIHIHSERGSYTGITIVATAQIPHPLIPMADRIRDIAQDRLRKILGTPVPHVTVEAMHVHFGDVTKDNPKLR